MFPRAQRLLVPTLVVSLVVFTSLSLAGFTWPAIDRLDVRFVAWVHRSASDGLVETMRVLTHLGSVAILVPLAVGAGFVLVFSGRRRAAAFVIVATIAGQLVDQALKASFRRARPELDDPFVELTTYAFPSAHAFGSTTTYGALALVLAGTALRPRLAVSYVAAAALLVALVCASRVVLGVHYLLDVLAGVAGGVALLTALALVFGAGDPSARARSGHEHPKRPWLHREPKR